MISFNLKDTRVPTPSYKKKEVAHVSTPKSHVENTYSEQQMPVQQPLQDIPVELDSTVENSLVGLLTNPTLEDSVERAVGCIGRTSFAFGCIHCWLLVGFVASIHSQLLVGIVGCIPMFGLTDHSRLTQPPIELAEGKLWRKAGSVGRSLSMSPDHSQWTLAGSVGHKTLADRKSRRMVDFVDHNSWMEFDFVDHNLWMLVGSADHNLWVLVDLADRTR